MDDPSIAKFVEEDEDETMHSGTDVKAFTLDLNTEFQGDDASTPQSPTGTDTGAALSQGWQSSKHEEEVKPQTQEQQSSAIEITGVMNMQNVDKNPAQEDESQLQRTSNQQAMAAGQSTNAANRPAGKQVPFALLLPVIEPQVDEDRAMKLQRLYALLKINVINKEKFVQRLRNLVGDRMLKMAVYRLQQGQLIPKPNSIPMVTYAQKASNVTAIKQERKHQFPMQVLNKQHQQQPQHMQFPQSSVANCGNTDGHFSNPNTNMTLKSFKQQAHDLQTRQGPVQGAFSDMLQGSGHRQPSLHKDESLMPSMAFAKQESMDQTKDQHTSQLSAQQGPTSISTGQMELSKDKAFEMMSTRPGFSLSMTKSVPMSITAQVEHQNMITPCEKALQPIEKRVIEYNVDFDTPGIDAPRPAKMSKKNHPVLNFRTGKEEYNKLKHYTSYGFVRHRVMDLELLESFNEKEYFKTLLEPKWSHVLRPSEFTYKELTLEFHSTFEWNEPRFMEPGTVTFALGRTTFEMNMAELGIALGFYTRVETETDEFKNSWRGIERKTLGDHGLKQKVLADWWPTIGKDIFYSGIHESYIRDARHRFLHKIIATTLMGRAMGQENVTYADLLILWAIIGKNEVNLACMFVESLRRAVQGNRGAGVGALPLGPYITTLAVNLGVFTRIPRSWFTEHDKPQNYRHKDMCDANYCPMDRSLRFVSPVVPGSLPKLSQGLVGGDELGSSRRASKRVRMAATLEEVRDMVGRMKRKMTWFTAAAKLSLMHQGISTDEVDDLVAKMDNQQ